MRIIHTADIHANREHWAEVCQSLDTIEADAEANGCDLFALSGDLADGPLANTEKDVFDALAGRIQRLANIAPVAMIYGTPTHDAPGSLEVFERIAAEHSIRILRPGKMYGLSQDTGSNSIRELNRDHGYMNPKAILFGVPEPSKKWLLANQGAVGKDEADQAARSAIRALFLGLGAMRREHADLPCILLYHGQVAGSKSGTGFKAEAGTGLVVTQDDLAAVGADYIALGDIHEPQQIGDLPAYYPGSVYPKDFGETHQAGCNVFEIEGADLFRESSVTRLDFPHPRRAHIRATWPDIPGPEAFHGFVTWLEITCTKAEAEGIDTSPDAFPIERRDWLPGSRVTLTVIPTETVRAAEITEKKSLHDKVLVYAEASALSVPASVLTKADEIEAEAARVGAIGSGAHIRIDRLILRGAIGIWKKSRKDEIDLDLHSYGPGVLALVGKNGAGKTTILENLHPWPSMLTRDGTLKDHFRLKDSFRDLYLTDEQTGTRYRCLITIRADIASGAAEYHIFQDTGAGFQPLPGITGRKEFYEAAIAELFGSLELYLRTAFATQRPTKYAPDLAQASPGQRKALFCELAGINYLDGYRAAAKVRGDTLDVEILRLDATISAAADVEEVMLRARAELQEADAAGRTADAEAQASSQKGKVLSAERDAIALKVSALEKADSRLNAIASELMACEDVTATAERSIAAAKDAAGRQGAAEAQLAEISTLEAERDKLRADQAEIHKTNQEALQRHQEVVAAMGARREADQARLDAAMAKKATAERDAAVAKARLSAPIAEHCPTCHQSLPAETIAELRAQHEKLAGDIDCLTIFAEEKGKEAAVIRKELDSILTPAAPEPVFWEGLARFQEIETALEWADKAGAEGILLAAREAAIRIEEAERRRSEAAAVIAAREAERRILLQDIQPGDILAARLELQEKASELDAEREVYTKARAAMEGAKERYSAASRAASEAEKRESARNNAQKMKAEKSAELSDWRFLETACGPNGIQALELDALAPSIAAVSNRLLSAAYGSRYQLEFRTTRIAGKGSKTKQVEDFEIVVLDTESGDEQTIDSLSGGEAVWIRKALYDGFAVIRSQNTGMRFQTVFLDEADGALDPEARMLYLRMLEAAHREAGRFQTIIVTHSTELQAIVEQTIDVSELQCQVKEEKADAA